MKSYNAVGARRHLWLPQNLSVIDALQAGRCLDWFSYRVQYAKYINQMSLLSRAARCVFPAANVCESRFLEKVILDLHTVVCFCCLFNPSHSCTRKVRQFCLTLAQDVPKDSQIQRYFCMYCLQKSNPRMQCCMIRHFIILHVRVFNGWGRCHCDQVKRLSVSLLVIIGCHSNKLREHHGDRRDDPAPRGRVVMWLFCFSACLWPCGRVCSDTNTFLMKTRLLWILPNS